MKKKLYLHIGQHKTGTTSVQMGLGNSRKPLRAQGYCYPKTGIVYSGHHNIAWQLADDEQFDADKGTIEELTAEIAESKCHSVILSSEGFDILNETQIKELHRQFSDFEVYVIVNLRRQDSLLQSKWASYVRLGLTRDFSEFVMVEIIRDKLLDYVTFLTPWEKTFGLENIRVRPFENQRLGKGILYDLLSACDVVAGEENGFFEPEQVNEAPGVKSIALCQMYLRHFASLDADRLRAHLLMIFEFGRNKGWNKEKVNVVSPEHHSFLMRNYRDSNDEVARKFLGREALFMEPFRERPVTSFDGDRISLADINEMYSIILNSLLEEIEQDKKKCEYPTVVYSNSSP